MNYAAALVTVRGNMFTRLFGSIEWLIFSPCQSGFQAQAATKHGDFELDSSTQSTVLARTQTRFLLPTLVLQ